MRRPAELKRLQSCGSPTLICKNHQKLLQQYAPAMARRLRSPQCRGGLFGVFEDGILAGQTRLRGDNCEASTPLSSHSRMARSNFPVLGQCSESCCHRLEISLATFRPCVVGSSARICTASSRAYLRQDNFEPLCCDSPFPLAQENSAREAQHYTIATSQFGNV